MRRTGDYERLQLWRREFSRETLAPDRLAIVRCESVFRDRSGAASLDLTFVQDDGTIVVVVAAILDTLALARNFQQVIVWPRSAAVAGDDVLHAIGERIRPWLRTLIRGRTIAGESIRVYRPCAIFDAARERGFVGAAPYETSLVTLAPALFVQRYGAIGSARARGTTSAQDAAALRLQAPVVEHDADVDGARWFRLASSEPVDAPDVAIVDDASSAIRARFVVDRGAAREDADWRIVEVPHPVPLDVYTTFDAADAPVVARFAVRGPETFERSGRTSLASHSFGGSTGIVRIAVRDDAFAARDADTDDAEALAVRLRLEGFDALVISYSRAVTEVADVMHFFGSYDDSDLHRAAAAYAANGGTYVFTLAPIAPWTEWAENCHSVLGQIAHDDGRERSYRTALERGQLVVDGFPHQPDAEERAERERAFTRIAAGATAIFLAAEEDAAAFCLRFAVADQEKVASIGIMLAPEPESMPLPAFATHEPFALMHGSTLARSRQLPVVTALARAAIPLVLLGPLADVYLGVTVRRYGGESTIALTNLSPGEITSLYRRAVVFVEASARPYSFSRAIRATSSGALPVVADDSPAVRLFRDAAPAFDPVRLDSITDVVRNAMSDDRRTLRSIRAQATVARFDDPEGVFAAVIAGYARPSRAGNRS